MNVTATGLAHTSTGPLAPPSAPGWPPPFPAAADRVVLRDGVPPVVEHKYQQVDNAYLFPLPPSPLSRLALCFHHSSLPISVLGRWWLLTSINRLTKHAPNKTHTPSPTPFPPLLYSRLAPCCPHSSWPHSVLRRWWLPTSTNRTLKNLASTYGTTSSEPRWCSCWH